MLNIDFSDESNSFQTNANMFLSYILHHKSRKTIEEIEDYKAKKAVNIEKYSARLDQYEEIEKSIFEE